MNNSPGENTFVRVTNQQIYEKLVSIEQKLESSNLRMQNVEETLRWHQIIGGFIITFLGAASAFLWEFLRGR